MGKVGVWGVNMVHVAGVGVAGECVGGIGCRGDGREGWERRERWERRKGEERDRVTGKETQVKRIGNRVEENFLF